MSACKKSVTPVIPVLDRIEILMGKVPSLKINIITLLLFLVLSSVTIAYIMYFLPVFLTSFQVKKQIGNSLSHSVLTTAGTTTGTSIVKRSRQKTLPSNPGFDFLFLMNFIP